MYQVLKEGPDFTCSVLLGGKKVRALVDTGASVSLRPIDREKGKVEASRFTFKPGR